MSAQEKLTEYGNILKAKSNTGLGNMTAEEIIGQALVKGICWYRDDETRYVSDVARAGKTIIVTETVISKVNEVVGGKLIVREIRDTTEIMTIAL